MTDPDITAEYVKLRDQLAARLRPYVQAHKIDEIAIAFVAEDITAAGWRPPLHKPIDIIATARAETARQALTRDDEQ